MLAAKLCLYGVIAAIWTNRPPVLVRAATLEDNTQTEFRFANVYGDHMVLQAKPFRAAVWGLGEVGQEVTVSLASEVYSTRVIKGGKSVSIS